MLVGKVGRCKSRDAAFDVQVNRPSLCGHFKLQRTDTLIPLM